MTEPPRISDAEWDVMNVVWSYGPMTAQDVHDRLAANDWNVRTVKTLLGRLVKKGALQYEVDGRRYVYSARVPRDECVRAESASFLDRVFDGAASPMLEFFVDAGKVTREDLDALRRLLDEKEGES